MLSPIEELYFWSQIMRDHADFIYNSLSPKETELYERATYFKNEWIKIRKESEKLIHSPESINAKELVNKALELLKSFIEYKKVILTKLLTCQISFNNDPSLINHMLNEANEFYRHLYLSLEAKKMNPLDELILLHKVWLRDASGHATSILSGLDPNEALLVKEANGFKEKFNNLFIKTYEIGLMNERTQVVNKAIFFLSEEVEKVLTDFIAYLDKVRVLRMECKALGHIDPLIPDHMIREEHYYLTKVKKALMQIK